MCRKLSLVAILIAALYLAYIPTVESGTGTYVSYYMPYLHTDTNSPVYCVTTNSGIGADNITSIALVIMSAEQTLLGNRVQSTVGLNTQLSYKRTLMLSFSGQKVYLGTATNASFDLSQYLGTSEVYGAKLTFYSSIQKSSNALRDSHLNCKNIPMSCFLGTTNPKRNVEGIICEAGYTTNTESLYKNIPYNVDISNFLADEYWADNTTGLAF